MSWVARPAAKEESRRYPSVRGFQLTRTPLRQRRAFGRHVDKHVERKGRARENECVAEVEQVSSR